MGTKYSSQSVSGYNSSPPADDGTVAASNQLEWQKHLDKIGAPLKTHAEGINTALVTALDQSSTSTTTTATLDATHHNQIKEIASTVSTAITITLSDAATMAAGYVVNVHNLSAVQHTLARATGADTINGTASNVPIAPYSQIKAWVNASANGYLVSQTPGVNSSGSITGAISVPDSSVITGSSDTTKKLRFEVDGFTSGQTRVITPPDRDITLTSPTLGTAQASTSGSSIGFTGIPAGTKRIVVNLIGVSTNGAADIQLQIGDAGGLETGSYVESHVTAAGTVVNATGAFTIVEAPGAAGVCYGQVTLHLQDAADFRWTCTSIIGVASGGGFRYCAGYKALSAELTQLAVITSDTFDAGEINILYE